MGTIQYGPGETNDVVGIRRKKAPKGLLGGATHSRKGAKTKKVEGKNGSGMDDTTEEKKRLAEVPCVLQQG